MFSETDDFATSGYALTSERIDLATGADWVPLSAALGTARAEVTSRDSGGDVFVGIAPVDEGSAYLDGVEHSVIDDLGTTAVDERSVPGGPPSGPPGEQDFWVAQASGPGTQPLDWEPAEGDWVFVVMNADASAGVSIDARIGATVPALGGLAWGLLGVGVVLLLISVLADRAGGPPSARRLRRAAAGALDAAGSGRTGPPRRTRSRAAERVVPPGPPGAADGLTGAPPSGVPVGRKSRASRFPVPTGTVPVMTTTLPAPARFSVPAPTRPVPPRPHRPSARSSSGPCGRGPRTSPPRSPASRSTRPAAPSGSGRCSCSPRACCAGVRGTAAVPGRAALPATPSRPRPRCSPPTSAPGHRGWPAPGPSWPTCSPVPREEPVRIRTSTTTWRSASAGSGPPRADPRGSSSRGSSRPARPASGSSWCGRRPAASACALRLAEDGWLALRDAVRGV